MKKYPWISLLCILAIYTLSFYIKDSLIQALIAGGIIVIVCLAAILKIIFGGKPRSWAAVMALLLSVIIASIGVLYELRKDEFGENEAFGDYCFLLMMILLAVILIVGMLKVRKSGDKINIKVAQWSLVLIFVAVIIAAMATIIYFGGV
jgi:hypothetical protein